MASKRGRKPACPVGSKYKVTTCKGKKVSCHSSKKAAKAARKSGQRVVKIRHSRKAK